MYRINCLCLIMHTQPNWSIVCVINIIGDIEVKFESRIYSVASVTLTSFRSLYPQYQGQHCFQYRLLPKFLHNMTL